MGLFGTKSKLSPVTRLPLLVMEDTVCFPHSVVPLYIQNKLAIKTVDKAMASDRLIVLAYKPKGQEVTGKDSLSGVASLCKIHQVMKLPNNSSRVLLECEQRIQIEEIYDLFVEPVVQWLPIILDNRIEGLTIRWMKTIQESFTRYSVLNKKLPSEALANIQTADNPHQLIDLVAHYTAMSYDKKLEIFNLSTTLDRLQEMELLLESEIHLLDLKEDIQSRVQKRMEKNQKEYFVNEQIKELNREIGKEDDDHNGFKELETKLKNLPLNEELASRVASEIKRLQKLPPMTPEASIARTWLELITELPWGKALPEIPDIATTRETLDSDHYDLEDAKERVLDYLAARSFNPDIRAPILCFVGPPGTGKTSLGKSIAKALNRNFVRVSLGGVRDEAEIRGHRRTYVGALPGKIIQGMKKAKQPNPVFLLDEIDKLASDQRGDPASALLEVLDPEQNNSFTDHYLELPYDLSRVLFVATANNIANIPYPLRDRMEIIEIPGYTPFEKKKISKGFIIPKQLAEHLMIPDSIVFTDAALDTIIESYTFESGVRQLERSISRIIRKSLRERLAENQNDGLPEIKLSIEPQTVHHHLKKPRLLQDILTSDLPPGLCYGLACTESGGIVMPVEVVLSPGKGELQLTGNLGDVMKESARIAFSLIRARKLAGSATELSTLDIHIHVPEGAIPKDGPSAGITLVTALISAISGHAVAAGFAMTGEITLTGRVLPVGGIREKVLAAHRSGIRNLVLPEKNKLDVRDLPDEIRDELQIDFVSNIEQVIDLVLAGYRDSIA